MSTELWASFGPDVVPDGYDFSCDGECKTRSQHETHVEDRHHRALDLWAGQLRRLGETWDPTDFRTLGRSSEWCAERVDPGPDADELTDEVVAMLKGEVPVRRFSLSEQRVLLELGLLRLLDYIPGGRREVGSEVQSPPSPRPEATPESEELADGWAKRMEQRSRHAGVVARVRRWRMRSQA